MIIEESLNVTFDENFPEPKSSSSVEDDRINEPIVQDLNGSSSLQVKVSNEGYPKSLKEAIAKPTTTIEEAVPEHTIVETYKTTTPEKCAYFYAEAEAIHMILSGI
ncbi:hypothetical protein Tco_0475775 [Tanacetum coccineum]